MNSIAESTSVFGFDIKNPGTAAVDLHVHTTASDGDQTSSEVVRQAKSLGIQVLAIADHDSTAGVAEAMETGAQKGVQVVPAVEIGILNDYENGFIELHLLGYYLDVNDPDLQSVLKTSFEGQVNKIPAMIDKLQPYYAISEQEVLAQAKGSVLHRPHIWEAVKKRYGIAKEKRQDFFDEYLKPGGKAFVEGTEPPLKEAIQLVIDAGGVPVLAHPGDERDDTNSDAVIRKAMAWGLRGIEVNYPYNKSRSLQKKPIEETWKAIRRFDALADELGLLKTGGSDFHGGGKPIGLGERGMTYEAFLGFEQACRQLILAHKQLSRPVRPRSPARS